MARGFGATDGVGSTDKIVSALASSGTLRSYGGWVYLTGAGGGNNGRLLAKDTSAVLEDLVYADVGGTFTFFRAWSGAAGANWSITAPATGAWHHLLVTYDGSATGNVPLIYLDGASQSVTVNIAPIGTLSDSSALAHCFGNRPPGNDRNLNGRLQDWAIWSVILSAPEAVALASGVRAGDLHPANLLEWLRMDQGDATVRSQVLANPTVTGTAVQVDVPALVAVLRPGAALQPLMSY